MLISFSDSHCYYYCEFLTVRQKSLIAIQFFLDSKMKFKKKTTCQVHHENRFLPPPRSQLLTERCLAHISHLTLVASDEGHSKTLSGR